jgi:hypothetical protein
MFQTTNQDEKSQLEIWSTLRYSKYSNVACWKTVIEFEDFLINSIIDIGFSSHFLFIKGTTCLEQSLFDRFHNNGDVPLQTVKSHTGYAHICQIIVIINNPHHVCLSCFFQVKPPAIAIHFFYPAIAPRFAQYPAICICIGSTWGDRIKAMRWSHGSVQ